MKVRSGFVSNSSSTSFYCQLCRKSFFGWDWDDNPVCPKCGISIDKVPSLLDFVIKRHSASYEEELEAFRREYNWKPREGEKK